ncbi:uncharacterized protein LOC129752192 [Uranotaenia lowii]|uniref:uncharacterized protein LOC129752192 n=1 Tax=Uranotaenia lowii TaxID=190385 RepID=UPI00247ACED5|nr:uncharacterized protein LOC129752192 [Uranotaenia lowii]
MGEVPPVWGQFPNPPRNRNSRTVPEWMDPAGNHGQIQFLRMKPVSPAKLPKNPFVISSSVERLVGKIEGGNPIDGGTNYLLKVRNPTQAAKLTQLTRLIDETPITIEEHPTLNFCHCVVTCGSADGLSNEELQSFLSEQGVNKVYRFTRKTDKKVIPTSSMVLTIKGTVPPPYIYFGFIRVATRPYYPRPLLCYSCGKYGHSKNRCQNAPICLDCGFPNQHDPCPNRPLCVNCRGNHPATSKLCPVHKQEEAIIHLKVDLGLTQTEATRVFQQHSNNNQRVSQNIPNANPEKDQRIMELELLVSKLQEEIEQLKNSNNESTLATNTPSSQDSEDSVSEPEQQPLTRNTQNITSTPKRNRNNCSIDSPPESTTNACNKKTRLPQMKPVEAQGKPPQTAPNPNGKST